MNSTGFVNTPLTPWIQRSGGRNVICSRRGLPSISRRTRMGLSIKTAPLPNSQVSLEISVGKEECSAAWDSVLKELSKKSQVNGFRKGRAPKQLVINQYGEESIKASACEEVIEKSIQKAIKDSGIHAIGQAEVDDDRGLDLVIASFDPKTPFTFKVKIDVWPETTFESSYDNLEVDAEKSVFDESLVDKALEELRMRESFPVLAPEGTKAQLGQIVVGSLTGYYRNDDGSKGNKLPEIAVGDSVEVKMTEGKYMPGFVEGLIGVGVSETRDVNVEFPQTNPRPELAGVKAIFSVSVEAIQDSVVPELDDEFAKKVSEQKTVKDLRVTIRERLDTESENLQERCISSAIEEKLASIVTVDLPESLVENQVKEKFAAMLSSFKEKGMADNKVKAMVTKENYEMYREKARSNVEKSLRVNFAFSRIVKDQSLDPSEEEVENQMALVRAELKGEEMDEKRVRDQIEGQLERGLALTHIRKTAKVNLVAAKEEKKE